MSVSGTISSPFTGFLVNILKYQDLLQPRWTGKQLVGVEEPRSFSDIFRVLIGRPRNGQIARLALECGEPRTALVVPDDDLVNARRNLGGGHGGVAVGACSRSMSLIGSAVTGAAGLSAVHAAPCGVCGFCALRSVACTASP